MAVTLHQVAPWNRELTNPYRRRYAQLVDAAGRTRYFRVEADTLDSLWEVTEIDENNDVLLWQTWQHVAFVFNLDQARAAVEARVAGEDIEAAVRAVGRRGTGRNHPRNVERRRSWGR